MLSVNENCNSQNPDVMAANDDCTDHDEYQYLDLIRRVIKNGKTRHDRTGTIIYCNCYMSYTGPWLEH